MHAELAKSQPQQQTGKAGFACHLATHGNRDAGFFTGLQSSIDQVQHRRVQRIVKVVYLIVDAVNGDGVLNQVISAN